MTSSSLLRAHIEDTLALIADREAQLRYQAQVPYVDVSMELFLQWEDWYRPSHEAFDQAFDRREAATLRTFHDVFIAVRDCCMDRQMSLEQLVQTTAWKRYSGAARTALGQLRSALAAVA
jgi:predicted ATPase